MECPDAPSPKAVMQAWDETCSRLNAAMESATEELLDTPAPKPGPPSADGKLTGIVNFMALHETYHVGAVCLFRSSVAIRCGRSPRLLSSG